MATQAQMELQASVRMMALENIDMQRDLLNWENQMKSEEKRTKIPRENSDPSTSADQSRAEIYKTEGNKYYTSGDYNKAITYYSKAIGADRNGKLSGILYTNRAQCQFKLGNLEECLIDCNETLRIAPLNEKAIFRRMEANYQAKNLQMAEKDCKQLLEINPKHTAGLSFQSRLKIELENNLKNTLNNGTSYTSTIDGIGKDLQFVKIPPHKQPNSTLKRIRITSNNIEGNSQAVAVERSAPIHKIDFPKEDLNNNEKKEIAQNNSPKWSTIDSVGIDISFIEKPDAEKKTDLKTIPIEGTKTLLDPKVTKNQENNAIKSDGPAIPLTSAAFFKNWKNFKEPSERFAWLKNISSVGFNDLLGSNLDSSLLSELLIVFCEYFVPNRIPVLPYLREIAKSDQLAILSLMMSKADQEALTTLLEFTRKLNEKELDYIAKQFSF